MIDPTLIIRKINLISQDFKEIAELSRKSLQEFLASRVDEVLAERYLERMIGRMIDINYHLITWACSRGCNPRASACRG